MTGNSDNERRETLLEFPCEFPVKIMGRDSPAFREAALSIVARHSGEPDPDAVRESKSREGNFVSITITITAVSQAQLDRIYEDLTAHDEILVAL